MKQSNNGVGKRYLRKVLAGITAICFTVSVNSFSTPSFVNSINNTQNTKNFNHAKIFPMQLRATGPLQLKTNVLMAYAKEADLYSGYEAYVKSDETTETTTSTTTTTTSTTTTTTASTTTETTSVYSAEEIENSASNEIIVEETVVEEFVVPQEEPSYIIEESPAVVEENAYSEELTATVEETTQPTTTASTWTGPVLTARLGTVQGPSGKETYYNLNMWGVIKIMKDLGYDYEFWAREDGVKMYGEYVMCAANLNVHPRGSLVETSLGTAIVCDTGGFASYNTTQIDIAVTW